MANSDQEGKALQDANVAESKSDVLIVSLSASLHPDE